MLGVGILRYQQVLFQNECFECFDGSEVTRKVNDSIVQKQYCVVEEIIEVELRSRRGNLFMTKLTISLVSIRFVISLDMVVQIADYR